MNQDSLTQEYLKECVVYDPETGIFVWKERPREHFKTYRAFRIINARQAGKRAGGFLSQGYVKFEINYYNYLAHRLAFLYMTGRWPENQVDHINHVRNDNRWANLKEATHSDNQRNLRLRKGNRSGFNGVNLPKTSKKWIAYIWLDSKSVYLGSFKEKAEAIECRKAANIKYGFHENHGH